MKIFYFTATGNSLYIAKKIGKDIYSIPKMIKENKKEFDDNIIGFVFPVYGLSVPRIVKNFIEICEFKAEYFFSIATYGNFCGTALAHIENIFNKKNLDLNYKNKILMVDNYLPFFDMKKQKETEYTKKIEENLAKILKDINSNKNSPNSNRILKFLANFQYNFFQKFFLKNANSKFYVENNCNSCKLCEKLCPVNNIKVNKKPIFSNKCELCYSCVHNCPENAIRLKNEKTQERFINKNIDIAEIIKANE